MSVVNEKEAAKGSNGMRRSTARGTVIMELAVLGLLLAGAFALLKAPHMENARDAILCLLGSFGGCGLLCYVYFHRD